MIGGEIEPWCKQVQYDAPCLVPSDVRVWKSRRGCPRFAYFCLNSTQPRVLP
jgi:hypothetical protein